MGGPFQGVVEFLAAKGYADRQTHVARILGLSQPQVSQYLQKGPTTKKPWISLSSHLFEVGYAAGRKDTNVMWLAALSDSYGKITQRHIADSLGVTQPMVSHWKNGHTAPGASTVSKLLEFYAFRLIEPLVEFEPIEPVRNGQSWRLTKGKTREASLRNTLEGKKGIYIFYDSAGNVTYVGKTAKDFWFETKQRLKAKLIRPLSRPDRDYSQRQGHIARYLSAYEVRVPAAIHNIESFLLRTFPNDLGNINIGKFKKVM